MVFINNSADYSACGMGKAPIITEETRQLLSGFTGITNKKAIAFQNFVDAIGGTNGTIWAALDTLYIPMFANNVLKDAFFNVKTGQINYSGHNITDANVANYYELTTSGIKIQSSVLDSTEYFYVNDKTTANCLLFAVSEPTNAYNRYIWRVQDTGTSSNGSYLKNGTFGNSTVQLSNTSDKCPIFVSSRNTEEGWAYIKSATSATSKKIGSVDTPTDMEILFGSGPQQFSSYKWQVGIKVFGFGDGLSAANAATFANAIAAFNDAMLEE